MQRRTILIYGNYFHQFYQKQTQTVRNKIDWTISIVRDFEIIPVKYFKHLEGTKDLYEIRIASGSNAFRVFCFQDDGNIVILLHGITKKTQKTPIQEIRKALQLQKQYYEEKK